MHRFKHGFVLCNILRCLISSTERSIQLAMTKEMLLLSIPFAYSGEFSPLKVNLYGSSSSSHHDDR